MKFWEGLRLNVFEKKCKEYGFKYYINNSNITVKTTVSSWIITAGKDFKNIELFHSNHMWTTKKTKREQIPGYHIQNKYTLKYKEGEVMNKNVLINILRYIYNHDKNKYKKDFHRFKKRNGRIDYLFEQIQN